ncbi:MAG TPA: hypothetical protein VNJ49_00085, partial [Bradyrhizobium sp.]|nr:hypothetical protein [Bradyrhizobium sp.]
NATNFSGGTALNNLWTRALRTRRNNWGLAAGITLTTMGAGLVGHKPASATDSGLGFYPTADIYPDGNFHFDYDTFGKGLNTELGTSVGLEYGFGKQTDGLFGRNEIGFDYLTSGRAGSPLGDVGDRVALNFKTQLFNNSDSGTRVSLGVAGLGSKVNFGVIDTRLLGYKTFSFGRVHAGVWRAFSRSGGSDTGGLQLGFDRSVGKRVIVGADYRTGPTGFLAPLIIYNLNDKAGLEIAVGRANNSGTAPRYQTYLAFDYNFDFKKAAPEPPNPQNLETAPGTANPGPNP